jgi:hypothetical protein
MKEFLHVLSPIHIARAAIIIDRLNVDVGEESISIDSVWVTKGRSVSGCSAVRKVLSLIE